MLSMGNMLKCFRKEKNLTIKQICTGLCSIPLTSQFERGESKPDALLFEYFMERIGVFPDDFAVTVTEKEYTYYLLKEQVYEVVESKQWENLNVLLNEAATMKKYCNERIVSQFIYFIKGILQAEVSVNLVKAVEYFKNAIIQTNSDIFEVLETDRLLGVTELHMLLLYLYYGIQSGEFNLQTGKELFYKLEHYISDGRMENREQAKIYPKLVCTGIHMLGNDIDFVEKIILCKKAITLLRTTSTFYDITEVLYLYIPLLRQINSEELPFYERQYEVFCELLKQGGSDTNFRIELMPTCKPKVYLIKEYLHSKRKELGLTQDELSENICEPVSYSRIERGETAPFPKKYQALTRKLQINWCYYRGELETNKPQVYCLRGKHRRAAIEGDWEKDLKILCEMESLLDMDKIVNYQYIKSKECMAKFYLNHMQTNEVYSNLESLMYLTKKIDAETEELVYYSQTEVEIVANMAKLLRIDQKYNEGIALLKTMLKQMSRSNVDFKYQWNGVSFALRVLSDLYFSVGEYEKSIELLNYVYKVSIRIRKGDNLSSVLDSIADNLEHMGKQYSVQYKKLYCQAYYVADFFNVEYIKKLMDDYYRKQFDPDIQWYVC